MPGLQSDGRRRVAHPAEMLPANSAGVYPLHCSVALRPRRGSPAVVAGPRILPANVVATKLLPAVVQLRGRRLNPAIAHVAWRPIGTAALRFSPPLVQLRPYRRNPAVTRVAVHPPATQALRFGRPLVMLRPWIRYRGQVAGFTLPAISTAITPLLIPYELYSVTIPPASSGDDTPWSIDPERTQDF